MTPSTAILIQARSTSSRLARKCYLPLPATGPSVLDWVHRRMESTGLPVFFLIPTDDLELRSFCDGNKWAYHTGPLEDVRERYRSAARDLGLTAVVRVTGDNPFTDPENVRLCIDGFHKYACDLFSLSGLPLGMGVEVFSVDALCRDVEVDDASYREHVSLHIKHFPEIFSVRHEVDPRMSSLVPELADVMGSLRLTLDESADYATLSGIAEALLQQKRGADVLLSSLEDLIFLYGQRPELFSGNAHVEQRRFQRQQ